MSSTYDATRNLFTLGDSASVEHDATVGILEALVDRFGVAVVTSALGDVCDLKAAHALEAWQDKRLSKAWTKAGESLTRTALSAALEVA